MSSDKVTFGSILAGITREGADEALRDAFVAVTHHATGSRPSDAGKWSVYIVAPALDETEDGEKKATGDPVEQAVGLSWFAKALPGMKVFDWSHAPSTQLGLQAAHRLGYRVMKDGADVPAPTPKYLIPLNS